MPFRPMQNYYDISYRPKKTTQAVPALPTRQSLRIRKKDPSGELLPEPSSSEIYQSVDEHVRSCLNVLFKNCVQTTNIFQVTIPWNKLWAIVWVN